MEYSDLTRGTLVRRYKRFLADVQLASGEQVVAHCPNTGAMTGLAEPGWPVWLNPSHNPKRKLAWTWELVETPAGLACIHSARANRVVGEALARGLPAAIGPGWRIRPEVRLASGSRADFLLEREQGLLYVEVKAVTLLRPGGLGAFPDAVSERAQRHVRELAAAIAPGVRAAIVFAVFHSGVTRVAAAADIDPDYAATLAESSARGLEVYALKCALDPLGIVAQAECGVEI